MSRFPRGFSEQPMSHAHSQSDLRVTSRARMHSAPTSPLTLRREERYHPSADKTPSPPALRKQHHQSAPNSPVLALRQFNSQQSAGRTPAGPTRKEAGAEGVDMQLLHEEEDMMPTQLFSPQQAKRSLPPQSAAATSRAAPATSVLRTDVLREIERRHKLGELPYYHGRMSCTEARELLLHRGISLRTFLMHVHVDASERLSFFLSLKDPSGLITHVPIVLDQYGVFLEKSMFPSVPSLVLHLRRSPLVSGGRNLGVLKGFLPCL